MLGLFDEALGAQLKAQKALVDAAKAYVEKQNDVAAQIAQQQRKGQQQQIALQKRIDKLMGGGPEDAPPGHSPDNLQSRSEEGWRRARWHCMMEDGRPLK